jgi:cation/acetate symporter
MTFTTRTRLVNPRLGTYFGIFASALAALFLLATIFEQLGIADRHLRWLMLAGPVLLYTAVGLAAATSQSLDYFAAGRRVPSIFTGLILAVSALGATGLAALTGVFFFSGFDGLAVTIGGLGGFVVMGILLAPFLRKFGAYTVPTYLGRRFESRGLRIFAAGYLAVPMLLIVAAELGIGAFAAGWLVGQPQSLMLALMVVLVLAGTLLGGMRSLTWSSAAQSITVLLAVLLPAAIVAVIVTRLPIPQLSYGPVVRSLIREEAALGLPQVLASPLAFNLPSDGFVTISKRFVTAFGDVGHAAFVITILTVTAGLASAPWLLPRVSATPGVYEARKSIGWATFFFGVLMLTMTSVAAFLREPLIALVLHGGGGTGLPDWLARLVSAGLVEIKSNATIMALGNIAFDRDGILLALPIASGLPASVVYLGAAALVAAALAGAGSTATALANLLAEDIVNGLASEPPTDGPRLAIARSMLVIAVAAGGAVALLAPTDPLKLLLWALTISAATAFPTLVLSIWWKRINSYGAAAGMTAGFAIALLAIGASEAHLVSIAGTVLAAIGVPIGTAAALIVSSLTPPPSRHVLELARDIRVPGGEILYDREMQRLRLKQRRGTQG